MFIVKGLVRVMGRWQRKFQNLRLVPTMIPERASAIILAPNPMSFVCAAGS